MSENTTTDTRTSLSITLVNNQLKQQIRDAQRQLRAMAAELQEISAGMAETIASAGGTLGLGDLRTYDHRIQQLEIDKARQQGSILALEAALSTFDLI